MTGDTSRVRRIAALAAPIIAGMVSQNVLNLVDTAFVGRLGPTALAAVGMGGFANWLTIAFLIGLGAGVQAITARRFGESGERNDDPHVASGLNAALILAATAGIPLGLVGLAFAPEIFAALVEDPEVRAVGAGYLAARYLAVPFVAANFAFRGFWNGTNRPSLYMATLISMHALNIVLDYGLIFGRLGMPALGARGAGLATSISVAWGTLVHVALATRKARAQGFMRLAGVGAVVTSTLRLSLPACVQQLTFSGGFVVFFAIAGRLGTDALAASTVLLNVVLICVLPGLGMGLAGASLVGQSLGRGDTRDARRWGWQVAGLGAATMAGLGLVVALGARTWLGVFITDSPATLELAVAPLMIMGLTQLLDPVVMTNILTGVGDTVATLLISIFAQWVLLLPGAYVVAVTMGGGIVGLWSAMVGYRVVCLGLVLVRFHRGAWATRAV